MRPAALLWQLSGSSDIQPSGAKVIFLTLASDKEMGNQMLTVWGESGKLDGLIFSGMRVELPGVFHCR